MAVFTCEKCGNKVDTRCKPKKCPACSESGTMCKVEAPAPRPKRARSNSAGVKVARDQGSRNNSLTILHPTIVIPSSLSRSQASSLGRRIYE